MSISVNPKDDISLDVGLPQLADLFKYLWGFKWAIGIFTFVSAVVSVQYALSVPNEYKSTAILAGNNSNSNKSNFSGGLGGLASIAGVNLGGSSSSDNVSSALVVLKTWDFLEKFIQKNEIQKQVYAANGWDEVTGEILYDPKKFSVELNSWVNKQGDRVEGPNGWELYSSLKGKIQVAQNKKNHLITLSVEHFSPTFAKKVLDLLIVDINKFMQERDKLSAQKSILYLTEQIKSTELSQMKTVFYQLVEEQTKSLMLAEVSDEYVFQVLSPGKVPVLRSKPQRGLIVILGTGAGFVISCFLVLLTFFRKRIAIQAEKEADK